MKPAIEVAHLCRSAAFELRTCHQEHGVTRTDPEEGAMVLALPDELDEAAKEIEDVFGPSEVTIRRQIRPFSTFEERKAKNDAAAEAVAPALASAGLEAAHIAGWTAEDEAGAFVREMAKQRQAIVDTITLLTDLKTRGFLDDTRLPATTEVLFEMEIERLKPLLQEVADDLEEVAPSDEEDDGESLHASNLLLRAQDGE